ncbi:MAG: nucleotidyltransferase family protein [Thermoleophilaceae bacterium]|nr:nucleotidyltransferase family protein [Thermoleophilaceae bacterium]
MIGGLVLAAGAGTRFGGAKQLAELDGRPMLEHAVGAMVAAPLGRVFVVLGARAAEVRRGVDLRGAGVVVCDAWAEGQSASLRAGIAALAACDAVVVALGDQPFLSPVAVERVLHARTSGADAVRATYGGLAGHPVLLEQSLFGRVASLRGDAGARALLDDVRVREVACDGLGRPDDIDTPDQLGPASGTTKEAITT